MIVVRRHHEQVYSLIHKTVYLQTLTFIAVVRILDNHLHVIVVKMLCCEHLVVGFLSPSSAYALRHTYLIFIM